MLVLKKQRCILPLSANAGKWIEAFEGLTGQIYSDWATPLSVFQGWERFVNRRRIKADANRLRSSYISHRVANTNEPEQVALETGNSLAVIMKDYLELATPEDAARWFKVSPSAQQLKALTAYAHKLKQASGVESDFTRKPARQTAGH